MPSDTFKRLIQANHILHQQNVVDAYGHISVRNPQNPETFYMSRESAPALISRQEDIEEYYVSDASPVSKNTAKGYVERFIHSEIMKRYKGVEVVVHAHSEVILPFTISSIPLRPVTHIGAAMGPQAPLYDISRHYEASDEKHDLLINNVHLGASLAAKFNEPGLIQTATTMVKTYFNSPLPDEPDFPPYQTVLMRGHGFTCVGQSIEEAVYRAVYTCSNARVQSTAMLLQGGQNLADRLVQNTSPKWTPIHFLSGREVQDTQSMHAASKMRPWYLWCEEVAKSGLYRNELLNAHS